FVGDTARVLHGHASEPPPPLRDVCPGLPEPVYVTVSAALAKFPVQRPASAAAFAASLTGASPVSSQGGATLVAAATPASAPQSGAWPATPPVYTTAPPAGAAPPT